MILRGAGGDLVDVAVVGYEHPGAIDPREQLSWHMVAGRASVDGLAWSFRMAALTCDESPGVSAWLRAVADRVAGGRGRPPAPLRFLEPNLGFRVDGVELDGHARIHVELDLEFRHPDTRRASPDAGTPTEVPVHLDVEHLRAAADEWDTTLRAYPPP